MYIWLHKLQEAGSYSTWKISIMESFLITYYLNHLG